MTIWNFHYNSIWAVSPCKEGNKPTLTTSSTPFAGFSYILGQLKVATTTPSSKSARDGWNSMIGGSPNGTLITTWKINVSEVMKRRAKTHICFSTNESTLKLMDVLSINCLRQTGCSRWFRNKIKISCWIGWSMIQITLTSSRSYQGFKTAVALSMSLIHWHIIVKLSPAPKRRAKKERRRRHNPR